MCGSFVSSSGSVGIVHLRCSQFSNPVGLHTRRPEFSWELVGVDFQKAWRIIVGEKQEEIAQGRGNLWDSGWQEGGETAFIPYEGTSLASRMNCFWKVLIKDQAGDVYESNIAHWSVGLLEESDWSAYWIGLDTAPEFPLDPFQGAYWIWDDKPHAGERTFEKEFVLESSATGWLWGLADDEAEVRINDQPVCQLLRAQGGFNLFPLPLPVKFTLPAGKNRLTLAARKRHQRDPHAGVILRVMIGGEERVVSMQGLESRLTRRQWMGGASLATDGTWQCRSDGELRTVKVLGSFGVEPWHLQNVTEYPSLPARYLRREFEAEGNVARATLYFSGLGLSEAWINGARVGDEVLSPHASDYHTNVFYRTFDVTDLLKEGTNAIACILGNGRFFAPRARVPFPMENFGCPKLRLQMEITYDNGRSMRLISDPSWNVSASGALGWNNEFDGEYYDARKDDPAWTCPGFAEDESWRPAQFVAAPTGKLLGQMSAPIRVSECLEPKNCWKTIYGTTIFDFGCNLVGWVRVVLKGQAGEMVTFRHAEEIESENTLAIENLRSALCTDTVLLKEGTTTYEPKFTYHGFRYVEVRGGVKIEQIVACAVNDDVLRSGLFSCSDKLVEQIVDAAVRGIRGNYRSMPTDCPQRDERMGWLGDRAGGAPGEMFLFDVSKLYRKWLDDIRLAQAPNGCVPDIAPPFWRMYSDNVTWPSCMVFLPYWLYRHYGDLPVAEKNYEAMKQWLHHLCGYLKDGLIERDIYGDWCVPPESPHLIHSEREDRKTHPAILASCYFARSLEYASEMAQAMGRMEEAFRWQKMRESVKEALNTRFFRHDLGCYDNGSQTASLLPLAFDLVPEHEQQRVFEFLVSKITESGEPRLGTGLVGGHWLLRTLTAFGRADLALALVVRETYPGWGYMIRQGATTIWELWNGDTAEPLMNSGNHVMLLGDLLPWLFEDVAGITPSAPGFAEVTFRPRFLFERLSFSHQSIRGKISSAWEIIDGKIYWSIEVPANVSAVIELPETLASNISLGGNSIALQPVDIEHNGTALQRLRVAPGNYEFTLNNTVAMDFECALD